MNTSPTTKILFSFSTIFEERINFPTTLEADEKELHVLFKGFVTALYIKDVKICELWNCLGCLRSWEFSRLYKVFPSDDLASALKLNWNKDRDNFRSKNLGFLKAGDVNCIEKRFTLSVSQRLYDTIGILASVTLYPKLLAQQIWLIKLEWDMEVDDDIKQKFCLWLVELNNLCFVKLQGG